MINVYGKDLYGLAKYGLSPVSETELPEEFTVDLSKYVPPIFRQIKELVEVWRSEGQEIGWLKYNVQDLAAQAFIPTATWGLTYWEKMYGVTTNLALTYQDRREILYAKMRGQGTTTKAMIAQTAEAFSGGEVEVVEDNASHLFIVRFIGIKGIPRNMNAFISMLEDIKPAHLTYKFEYRYTLWGDMFGATWGEWGEKTIEEIRTMKGD